ncbi:MAG: ATP-binding cassette domain-containing protein [Lachnospiraceae bacterium]|nr:ATP-binding cassette domain-containing protein [Lachnospiraceae bacterium]
MIEIKNLNKTYDKKSRNANHVLHDVSLTLPDVGFVCIIGASGCGKTSLLNAVGGLDSFDGGEIKTGGIAVSKSGTRGYERERNNSFSYIFQNYYLLSDRSVAYNVYLGLHSLALTHKERLVRVRQALGAVNMLRYARRMVGELSGGQQQRVAIARAIARRPRVIFADEPTGNLDEENTINICTLLRQISKTSLVVMVTHEERIARFFADRIITLADGRVASDETEWKRKKLSVGGGNTLYAGDYENQTIEGENIKIRVLTEEGTKGADLTIAILNDRIVIKTDDARAISCSKNGETPVLEEGTSPVLTLAEMDDALVSAKPDTAAAAGYGFPVRQIIREAGRLLHGEGMRRRSILLFLAVMTILIVWMVGDYLTLSSIDPREFIVSDSHILELAVERGEALDPLDPDAPRGVLSLMPGLIATLREEGADFDLLPHVTASNTSFSITTYPQLGEVSVRLKNFSYAPVERLDKDCLVYGRMPEIAEEVVIDRWVLEYVLAQDGVLQNHIVGIEEFVGMKLDFFKKAYDAVIVGICDSGNPTLYLPLAGLISVGDMGMEVIGYSEFMRRYNGLYTGDALALDECIVITNTAGISYANKIGSNFMANTTVAFKIKEALQADTYAKIVISDDAFSDLILGMNGLNYNFYAPDKEEIKAELVRVLKRDYEGKILYKLRDRNGEAMRSYKIAASLKADARTIVTFTIIFLSMVMLYLLQRSYVQQRTGMIAVYRLLGLPKRKIMGIFVVESFLFALRGVLPAAALTWAVVAVLNLLTDLGFFMILPWQAGALVCLGVTGYYLLVSLLPVIRLLLLPPARLAAKYDI